MSNIMRLDPHLAGTDVRFVCPYFTRGLPLRCEMPAEEDTSRASVPFNGGLA